MPFKSQLFVLLNTIILYMYLPYNVGSFCNTCIIHHLKWKFLDQLCKSLPQYLKKHSCTSRTHTCMSINEKIIHLAGLGVVG